MVPGRAPLIWCSPFPAYEAQAEMLLEISGHPFESHRRIAAVQVLSWALTKLNKMQPLDIFHPALKWEEMKKDLPVLPLQQGARSRRWNYPGPLQLSFGAPFSHHLRGVGKPTASLQNSNFSIPS